MITGKNNLYENMLEYIHKRPEGVASSELVKMFMNCSLPAPSVSSRLIKNILKDDERCTMDNNGMWKVSSLGRRDEKLALDNMDIAAVFILSADSDGNHRPANISIWETGQKPEMICSKWLINPYSLPPEESNILIHKNDPESFNEDTETGMEKISDCLKGRTSLFLSAKQQDLFNGLLLNHGFFPVEDTILASTLFRAAGVKIKKPISLENCFRQLFSRPPETVSAPSYGETLAETAYGLISRAMKNGVRTKDDIEKIKDASCLPVNWSKKSFNKTDIDSLPSCPGVYGFKDSNNNFFYIGKSTDLKRRISGYFRCTPDSSRKCHKIKDDSHSFIIHRCGSELEALLYEYRLIKKYNPGLNNQHNINERKGSFSPIQDCIIILPHAEKDKQLSLWFRRGKKIRLQTLDSKLKLNDRMNEEINDFFYSRQLPVSKTDFPEYEIAYRWIKRHREHLNIIPVDRMSSAEEIFESMKSSV